MALFLNGERLHLRAVEVEDAALLIRWGTRPETRRLIDSRDPIRLDQEEAWLRRFRPEQVLTLVIVLREGQRPIGCVSLSAFADEHADLGITLGEPDCWGHGYGSEATALMLDHAFDGLGLHRVGLGVFVTNPRAIACYEKLGFVREALLREAVRQDGRWVDEVRMSIMDREWRARRSARPGPPAGAAAAGRRPDGSPR